MKRNSIYLFNKLSINYLGLCRGWWTTSVEAFGRHFQISIIVRVLSMSKLVRGRIGRCGGGIGDCKIGPCLTWLANRFPSDHSQLDISLLDYYDHLVVDSPLLPLIGCGGPLLNPAMFPISPFLLIPSRCICCLNSKASGIRPWDDPISPQLPGDERPRGCTLQTSKPPSSLPLVSSAL